MNLVPKTELAEVRLSVRDLISLAGACLTLVCALWAFSSDIKTTITQLGLRLEYLEKRVTGLEAKTVRESAPEYRELMQRWMAPQPTPSGSSPRPASAPE
jgi:hypothetical protein